MCRAGRGSRIAGLDPSRTRYFAARAGSCAAAPPSRLGRFVAQRYTALSSVMDRRKHRRQMLPVFRAFPAPHPAGVAEIAINTTGLRCEAPDGTPNQIEQLLDTALAQHRAGRSPEAERLYERVLQLEPTNANAWYLRSVKRCRRAATNQRQNTCAPRSRTRLKTRSSSATGRSVPKARQPERGARLLSACHRAQARLGRGVLQSRSRLRGGRRDRVSAVGVRTGMLPQADLAPAAARLIALLRARDSHDRALACYTRLPQSGRCRCVHSAVASVLTDLGRFDDALTHFGRALQLEPGSAALRRDYAAALQEWRARAGAGSIP